MAKDKEEVKDLLGMQAAGEVDLEDKVKVLVVEEMLEEGSSNLEDAELQ